MERMQWLEVGQKIVFGQIKATPYFNERSSTIDIST